MDIKKRRTTLYLISCLFWFSLYSYVSEFSIYAKELGATVSQIGFIVAAYGLTQTLLRIPFGLLSDYIGRRKPFIIFGTSLTVICSLIVYINPSVHSLLILKILAGIAAATWVLFTVTYAAYYDKTETKQAMGSINSANSLGQVTGMIIGGIITAITKNPRNLFLLSTIAGTVGLLLSFRIDEVKIETKQLKISDIPEVLKNKTLIIGSVLAIFVQLVMYAATFTFGPLFAKDMGLNGIFRSVFVALGILPIVLFAPYISTNITKKLGAKKVLNFGFIVMAVFAFLFPMVPNKFLLLLTHFLIGIGYACTFPLLMGISIHDFDNNKRATAMGVFQAFYGIGIMIGPAILGVIIEKFNIQYGFIVLAIICIVAVVIVNKFVPSSDGE